MQRPAAAPPRSAAPIHSPFEPLLVSDAGSWKRQAEPRSYNAATLARYLGPESSRWTACDVVDVAIASYAGPSSASDFAMAEIFRFHSERDAFAAYSVHRAANRRFAEIPNEAFRTSNSVMVWRGMSVVRVIGGGTRGVAGLDELARTIVQQIPVAAARPAGFELFPPASLIPRSEILTMEPTFGYEILRDSLLAQFSVGPGIVEGLIHPLATLDETMNAFQEYRQSVGRSAKTLDPMLKLGDEGFFAQDPMLGNIVAFRSGLYLVIYRGNARPEALIDLATATDARVRGKLGAASGQ